MDSSQIHQERSLHGGGARVESQFQKKYFARNFMKCCVLQGNVMLYNIMLQLPPPLMRR